MTKTYDVIIIGGGPGGYIAASHASKNGLKTALVEASYLGGTCLNTGCIPSKTYLKAASIATTIAHAEDWGISAQTTAISLQKIKDKKDTVIAQLRNGISFLMRQRKIDVYNGLGKIQAEDMHKVIVTTGEEELQLHGEHIVVATGSKPIIPNIKGIQASKIFTTDTIFDVEQLPNSLAIVGGGIIGVEFANIFAGFGRNVTIIEAASRIIATEDEEASKTLTKSLQMMGVKVLTDTKVTAFQESVGSVHVHVEVPKGHQQVEAEAVLICIGRAPNLSAVEELQLRKNGPFLEVDQAYKTSIPHIIAIGDVIGGYQLAHVASAEGIVAIDHLLGKKILMNMSYIPRCIYTTPEIASVGLTEQQAKGKGIVYKVEKYNHSASGKALAIGEIDGFTKIIYDERYGEMLGVTIVGPFATEMISESTAFMTLEGTITELANTIHPHPTMSEGVFEAALKASGK